MIHVALIEDNFQYRTAVSIILQLNENLKLIHKMEDCKDLIPLFQSQKPDVVLMDIDLPETSGIEGVYQVKKNWPDIKVLMLTVFEDDYKIFGAIKAGADGYLLKKDAPQKILDSIEAAFKGESPMNGMIAARVLDFFHKSQQQNISFHESGLTDREKEILLLLIRGLSYKEIASSIFISTETLNSHIKNIYRKLNIHSRSELAFLFGRM